ncbi:hypothetical protein Tco_1483952 [Tanacetum coccineum]
MEILPVSTLNNTTVVIQPHIGNPDLGTAVEYRRTLLASLKVSILDKPHFKLENLLRRFIHESNPDDAEYLIHGNKEKKYVWSLIKSPAADYNLNWIEEYINRLFRSSVANYDKDSELGIHHWPELRKGYHEMRRASITKGDVHSNSKIKLIHDYPAYTICPNPYEVIYTYMHGGIRFMGINEVYKFGDGTIRFIYEELETMLKANTVGYIRGCLNSHAWIDRGIKRSRRMMKLIERILKARK